MASIVTYKYIKQNPDIMEYIRRADKALEALGYTEHSFAHVERTAQVTSMVLEELGYDERTVELAKIASIMHDIGNVINRADHAQSGAVMAFRLLDNLSMPASEICSIISAIGNHDESTGIPASAVSAALILADKADVRRSRVRDKDFSYSDIHDRVNYAVKTSELKLDIKNKQAILKLTVDTGVAPVMEYFEIFLARMIMCKNAAAYLGLEFKLVMNETKVL